MQLIKLEYKIMQQLIIYKIKQFLNQTLTLIIKYYVKFRI